MSARRLAVVPAAGSGSRFGQATPKQYTLLAGQPLLAHTLAVLCAEPRIDQVWVVISPDDDNALLRVINVPARGIGARTVENLQTASRERGVSLWQAACGQGGGRSAASLGKFVLLIEQLRADAERLSFAQLVSHLIAASGLRAMYEADKDGEDRLENLDELISAALPA